MFLRNITDSAKSFIIKIVMDRSYRWKKSKMAKKNFAIQFSNIYCNFLIIPLKPTREIYKVEKICFIQLQYENI